MDLKRLLNWLKSKITKIEKNLNETVKYIQISCKKCLTLDVSAIERSVLEGKFEFGPKNDVRCRELSAIKCPLHRGFVMRV